MKTTLKYFRPYIPVILLVVVALFGQAMCELFLPGYMSNIINKGILPGDMDYIYRTGIIMLIIAAASMGCGIVGSLLAARVAAGSARDVRSALFRRVTDFSEGDMDRFSTASLITRSTNDVQTLQQTTVMVLRMALFAPVMGVGAVIRAVQTCKDLTWILGLAILIIIGLMLLMFFLAMPRFKRLQQLLDKLNLIIGERLSGLLVIRAFNSELREEDRFDQTNQELTRINIFINRMMSFLFPAVIIIMNLVGIAVIWFGAKQIDLGHIMVGDLLAFIQYGMHVIISFMVVTMMFIMIPRAAVSGQRISAVLEVEPSIKDKVTDAGSTAKANRRKAKATAPGTESAAGTTIAESHTESTKPIPASGQGRIEFKNVYFAYSEEGDDALIDISFTAEPGKTTAIIGSTGSGKSTLLNLIPRFYDVKSGSVELDGTDIRDIPLTELRKRIGLVPQKGLLFSGTIAENLAYGDPNATADDLRHAADIAQATEFIDKMPDGMDTMVAQGGTSVSGGQKQRLSIARALVKKPDILLFDDSFSALDFRTDAQLRKALRKEFGHSTMVIVAQRINTIMDVDLIVALDDGKIAGTGTHKELLKTCDIYREIAKSQLSPEELEKGVS